MQTSLREKVAVALGWVERKCFDKDWNFGPPDDPDFDDEMCIFIPDPEDISVVESLARKAIEKSGEHHNYSFALCMVLEADSGYEIWATDSAPTGMKWVSEATPKQRLIAALSVLHGVSVEEVLTWK